MEEFADVVEGMKAFVKPGDGELSARLHVARTVCRRAERAVLGYFEGVGGGYSGDNGGASVEILKYMNRLSDLLFVLACACGKF
jgi:cob(I)alamin adenosyltransferase